MAKSILSQGTPVKSARDKTAVSVKVTLRGLKPPIWRRVLMTDTMTLGDLHLAIQAAMGWDNSHLHAFNIDGRQYGEPDILEDGADEDRMKLKALIKSGLTKFTYTYDFGDDWEHIVTLEKTQPAKAAEVFPLCVAGKRACPPDDCGGTWGYEELLDIVADPSHPSYGERKDDLPEGFNPDHFDLAATNALIATRFGRS